MMSRPTVNLPFELKQEICQTRQILPIRPSLPLRSKAKQTTSARFSGFATKN
jgi:hypothetical protein